MSVHTVFTVPKDRQRVTVNIDKGITIEGEIFLEYFSTDLSIHQKVTAFLENSNCFFPIQVNAEGGTEFINKKNVLTVDVEIPEGPDANFFAFRPMQKIPIIAYFGEANSLRGDLTAEVPKEKARLSDCLNMPNRFLCVHAGQKMSYINKDTLQKVVYTDK